MPIDALSVLCAQLTRDLLAIAKLLLSYREVCKRAIGSGETTLCHDIYPARPITTDSLATNTYFMIDGHSPCAPL